MISWYQWKDARRELLKMKEMNTSIAERCWGVRYQEHSLWEVISPEFCSCFFFSYVSETLGDTKFSNFCVYGQNPKVWPFIEKLLRSTLLCVILENLSIFDLALSGVKGLRTKYTLLLFSTFLPLLRRRRQDYTLNERPRASRSSQYRLQITWQNYCLKKVTICEL